MDYYYPDIAKKLSEIKKTGDNEAYKKALKMLTEKKGMTYADDMAKVVSGTAEKGRSLMKTMGGEEFLNKIAKLRALKGLGKNTLKSVPILGTLAGLGSAISSGDVAAALPVFGDSEMAGPEKGSPEEMFESGKINQAQYLKAINPESVLREAEISGRARASDMNRMIDKGMEDQRTRNSGSEDFTGENSYNRDNIVDQTQPMSDKDLEKFNKLRQFLGR